MAEPDIQGPKKAHVLVIDADDTSRETLRQMLEHEGLIVTEATSAEHALALAATGTFGAVITDLSLGDRVRDGLWLLHRLRSIPTIPHVPVIAIKDGAGRTPDGFLGVLIKPLDARQVAAVVRDALAANA
jgi:CheY-like chemotaxis protein